MNRMRVITIASGRQITLTSYLIAIKHAIAHPEQEYKEGLSSWWTTTGREMRRQFRESIHDRINQAVPYVTRGI